MSYHSNTKANLNRHYTSLLNALAEQYDDHEAKAIANRLVEHLLGLKPHQRIMARDSVLSEAEQAAFEAATTRLQTGEPIQYVIGHEEFCGLRYGVDKRVLIPRPETEELVAFAVAHLNTPPNASLLELGTGSGCIALSIAAQAREVHVFATDISQDALAVAQANLIAVAEQTNESALPSRVQFLQHDLYSKDTPIEQFVEIIVSNPPYIPVSEAKLLDSHVVKHEPSVALFVEDESPMRPYAAIAHHACTRLKPAGMLIVEVHAPLAQAVADCFLAHGLNAVEVLTDSFGRKRFVKALRA